MVGVIGRVLRDTRGAVAVYMALGTMFLLPLAAISIDLTRFYTLNTELELAAQAAALSAAKELDFTAAGMAAAAVAARQTVQNYQTGANDPEGGDVEIETIQFLRALPPAGQSNYGDYLTTTPGDVRYVRAITEVRGRQSVTMDAYLSLWKPDADATASTKFTVESAVAGRTAVACRTLPLMTCNPAEGANDITSDFPRPNDSPYPGTGPDGTGPGFAFLSDFLKTFPQWTRRQMRIKFIGPDTGYANGVFGLLEPQFTEDHGAKGIEDELAIDTPTSCIVLDEVQAGDVDVKTGQAQTIVDGINIRFDIFQGNWKSERNNPAYPPAQVVTKGLLPKSPGKICTPDPAEPGEASQKLPQDECFNLVTAAELEAAIPKCYALGTQDGDITTPGNNKGFAGRYGNGIYDMLKYFQVNHPTMLTDLDDDGLGDVFAGTTFDDIVAIEADWLTDHGMVAPASATAPSTGNFGEPPGRHAIFLWENGYDGISPGQKVPGPSADAHSHPTAFGATPIEEGFPQCSSATPKGPERRNLFVAVVNCIEHEDELNSGDRIVKVQEFAEVFLTESADHDGKGASGDKGAIYVEVKRAVKPGSTSNIVLRDLIQLY